MKLKKIWIATAITNPLTHSSGIMEFDHEPTEEDICKFIDESKCNEYVKINVV